MHSSSLDAAGDRCAITLDAVSVCYRVPLTPLVSLKEYAVGRWRGAPQYRIHEALRDVSLEVAPGDAVAVIGANGSGKTTLLRLMAGVLPPGAGRVRTVGRVAPILDIVGALHPDLTGRENIFLNGTMLGLTRGQIAARLERIVEFAEVYDFIDAPLRSYSSGMVARLGFAIASDTEPDILLIDEALGVGDERFQRKCAARIDAIRAAGTTFVLVTHDTHSALRLCTRALWLEHGRVRALGPAPTVVASFLDAHGAP